MWCLQHLHTTIFLSVLAVASGFTLPPSTGPYFTGRKPYVLNHVTADDPVAPNGTGTSVLVNFYYPTLEQAPLGKYVARGLADYYETYFNLTKDTFYNITASINRNAKPLPETYDVRLPTLLFGPPYAGPPSEVFTSLLSDLASHGYTVVTIDHPFEQPFLEYPDGTQIPGLAVDAEVDPEAIQKINKYRITDVFALLDALPKVSEELELPVNLTHFVTFGHSLGGSAALDQVLVAKNMTPNIVERHFLGAMNIDGEIFGIAKSSSAPLDVPSLLLAAEHHSGDPTWEDFVAKQTEWTKILRVEGTIHTDFSDLILWKQWMGLAGGNGSIEGNRMVEVTRRFVGDFFAFVDGKGEGVLSGSEEEISRWPEVVFDYNGTVSTFRI